jgi:hypothetical protein
MLAHVTDTCPSSTYLDEQLVANGEYDGSQQDYLLANPNGTVVKAPQLTDEVMILIPSSNDFFWKYAGKGTLKSAGTNFVTDILQSPLNADQTAAANRADAYDQAAYGVWQTLVGGAADTTAPYGHWVVGQSKAEMAAAAAAKQVPLPPYATSDACGDTPPQAANTWRFALVTATCTEATFPKVADPGVANWQVGGSQFGMTYTSPNGPWLLYATLMADDNSSEMLVLVPQALGDVTRPTSIANTSTMGPANGDLNVLRFGQQLVKAGVVSNTNPVAISAGMRTPLAGTHDYFLTWIEGGQPSN